MGKSLSGSLRLWGGCNGTKVLYAAIEVRKAEDAVTTLRGYAAVYDSPSDPIMGRFIERLAPGCFDAALASNPDVLCRFEHGGSDDYGADLIWDAQDRLRRYRALV